MRGQLSKKERAGFFVPRVGGAGTTVQNEPASVLHDAGLAGMA